MQILRPTHKALVVDDDSRLARVVATLLTNSRGFDVRAVSDPFEAYEIIRTSYRTHYDLVLMDYQMPGMDGIELLRRLKKADASTTYVMMTGRNDLRVVINALKEGIQGFVIKPLTRDELLEAVDMALEKTRLVQRHMQLNVYGPMLEGAIGGVLSAMELISEEEHDGTAYHSKRVSELAEGIASEFNLSQDELKTIRVGALFHDIGKIAIPDHILLKPGPLSEDERKIMMEHPEIGWRIIKDVQTLSKVAEIVRAHHERYDGRGYPDHRSGNDIPLGARIATVADSFEAMVAPRVYSKGRSIEDALREIRRCAGTQFDPEVAEIFLSKMETGKLRYVEPTAPILNTEFCVTQPTP